MEAKRYGEEPTILGTVEVDCKEMMFYQYLPIKLHGNRVPALEGRLKCFERIVHWACSDFVSLYGIDRFNETFVYLTAKNMYQTKGGSYNREGYHTDGFMTDDINYIWCNKNPTTFNRGVFNLTQDDQISLIEMEEQAFRINEIVYPVNSLLRLDQYNVHKVSEIKEEGMRCFVKVSFSKDRYDLEGNAHNYLLDYDWEMKPRRPERNIPQSEAVFNGLTKWEALEHGYAPGEQCNREGCTGTIQEREKDGGCYCHISPPCGYCIECSTYCPECNWEEENA